MGASAFGTLGSDSRISLGEVTGAIGDSVTVLPVVVAISVLTELSLGTMLLWFGVFQVVWGLYYRVPLSVEPMKALAALVLAGAVTTGEFLVAGTVAGGVLLVVGTTGSLSRIERYVGEPVVRGVQLAVALLLLETGVSLGGSNLPLAALAAVVAVVVVAVGYRKLSGLLVLLVGAAIAATQAGGAAGTASFGLAGAWRVATPLAGGPTLPTSGVTWGALEAAAAQLAMTVGNAAIATSLLLSDFFDRDVSPDELSTSMGVMNLLAVPLGGLPMCHGSGGVAGKHAFGARTAVANVVLGVAYVAVAVTAVGVVAAFPLSMLGVVLVLVAVELGRTSLDETRYAVVVPVGVVGVLVNVGAAVLVGVGLHYALRRWRRRRAGGA